MRFRPGGLLKGILETQPVQLLLQRLAAFLTGAVAPWDKALVQQLEGLAE